MILEGHGAFVCDQDLALTVRIRDLNRRFGGLQVSPGLRFACCRRYRGASCARVDGAAPSVTSEGRWAALGLETWMPREPKQRTPLVWLCYATCSC